MSTTPQQRDRFWFRFLIGAICLLPVALIIVQLSFGRSSSSAFDAANSIYCLVGLALLVSLLVFCFRVWKRNRRMALTGFALIAALIILWLVSPFL
jgi:uncharacterized membrane protein YuzA (DUF378 family)